MNEGHSPVRHLIETAVQVIHQGFTVAAPGSGGCAAIYITPIDAVSPLTVPEAQRLLWAKALAGLLTTSGFHVRCYSLFGDHAEPVKNLAVSVWLRYLELCGIEVPYFEGCYQGDYIYDFAATVHRTYGERWRIDATAIEALGERPQPLNALFEHMRYCFGKEAAVTLV